MLPLSKRKCDSGWEVLNLLFLGRAHKGWGVGVRLEGGLCQYRCRVVICVEVEVGGRQALVSESGFAKGLSVSVNTLPP